jgi:thioredoxin-related protein
VLKGNLISRELKLTGQNIYFRPLKPFMKNFITILITVFFLGAVSAQTSVSPETADKILKKAYQQAKKEKKNVLVMFHASWCGWCHRMDSSINDPVCKKFFSDNYVVTHLVIDEYGNNKAWETPGSYELRKQYHGEDQGIPFWLIFDAKGKLLADSKIRTGNDGPDGGINVGCPVRENEVSFFIQVLKNTSRLTADELAIIRKRFLENDN